MKRWSLVCLVAATGCSGGTSAPLERATGSVPRSAPGRTVDLGGAIARARFGFQPGAAGPSGAGATWRVQSGAGGRWAFQPSARLPGGPLRTGSPLAIETVAVDRGVKPAVAPEVSIVEGALLIRRDAVEERLEGTADGMEQSWRFGQRPPGGGDLVVRLAVSGQRYTGETARGLHFTDDAQGIGVRYGVAYWVDARGVRTELRPRFSDGEIRIEVPAALVDGSAYPAVLDPFINPEFDVDLSPPQAGISRATPAIEHFRGKLTDDHLVAWIDDRKGNPMAWCVLVGPDGQVKNLPELAWDDADPAGGIAVTSTDDEFLVFTVTPQSDVMVSWIDPLSGKLTRKDRVSQGLSKLQRHVAAATNDKNESLVVYAAGGVPGEIYGAIVDKGGSHGEFLVFSDPKTDSEEPAVASNGADYRVVFNRIDVFGNGRPQGIYAQEVGKGGTIGALDPLSDDNPGSNPAVAHADGKYVATWSDTRNAPADIYMAFLPGSGNGCPGKPTQVGGDVIFHDKINNEDAIDPAITFDGMNFLVLFGVRPFPNGEMKGVMLDGCDVVVDGDSFDLAKDTSELGISAASFDVKKLSIAVYVGPDQNGVDQVHARVLDTYADGAPCDRPDECASLNCQNNVCVGQQVCNCNIPNGNGFCPQPGQCAIASCNPGFDDCNGVVGDGCEADLTGNANCGACGNACTGNACVTSNCLLVQGNRSCVSVDTSACATPFCSLGGGCNFADTDHDGLSDKWETNGYVDLNCNGVDDGAAIDIPLPGANPAVADVYVRYDFMEKGGPGAHSHQPPAAALAQVTQAWAARGVALHFLPPAGPIAETVVTTLDSSPAPACAGPSVSTIAALRAANLRNAAPAYHYMVFAHRAICPDGNHCAACPPDPTCLSRPDPGATGSADLGGDDAIIAFGPFVDANQQIGIETWASTIMHELGHNFGLKHGGADACINNKPHYQSVMNYSYQLNAIPVAEAAGSSNFRTCVVDADCGPPAIQLGACATSGACHCTDDLLGILGTDICYRVDYSAPPLPSLNELVSSPGVGGLDEHVGVDGPNSSVDLVFYFVPGPAELVGAGNGSAIDWDAANGIQGHVQSDINNDARFTLLTTRSDWAISAGQFANLDMRHQCTAGYGPGAPDSWSSSEVSRDQAIADHMLHPPAFATIDVRPNCNDNWIILGGGGTIPVAIYGSATLNVDLIDTSTLRLGGAPAVQTAISDLNGDGRFDMTATFTVAQVGVDQASNSVTLTGALVPGWSFHGADAVNIVITPGNCP